MAVVGDRLCFKFTIVNQHGRTKVVRFLMRRRHPSHSALEAGCGKTASRRTLLSAVNDGVTRGV